MSFLYPHFLWLLIPLILFFIKEYKTISLSVPLIILMLITLTLSRPIKEEAIVNSTIEAKDIIIALDVSYSMKATDISPNRYLFAKEMIKDFLDLNPTDNIMLIAFTSNPLILSPSTTDHPLIKTALDSLNTDYILTKGTSLKKLFIKLKKMHIAHRELLVISDGGEENNIQTITKIIQEEDISLTILALGTRDGITLKDKENKTLTDKQGNLVIARVNPLLEQLTGYNEGIYLTASATPFLTAQKITNSLEQKQHSKSKIKKMQHHYQEYYQLPLFIALLLFLLLHTKGIKYLIIIFLLFGVEVEASFLDSYYLQSAYTAYEKKEFIHAIKKIKEIKVPSLESAILLANSYYKEEAFKMALKHYASILSTQPKIKQLLYYNIANSYAKLYQFKKAKKFYIKSLSLGYDQESLFNLQKIIFLTDKKSAGLGIAHPKSQNSSTTPNKSQEEDKEKKNEEDAPSSGSGSGGESKSESNSKKGKLLLDEQKTPQPLGSKAYELINKGYIRETHPW